MRKLMGALMLGWCLLIHPVVQAKEGAAKGSEGDSQYLALDSLLVNLEGRRHYLRADIQLLVESAEHVEKMKVHMPAIRHSLIMLFSGRNPEQIATADEREKLRQIAKDEIRKVLAPYQVEQGLEDLFFTDFLVQ